MTTRSIAERIPARMPATTSDLGTAALDPLIQLVVGSRVSFAERLDEAVLARAVRALLDREPVLGCWLRQGTIGGEWVRCTGLDERSAFETLETDDPDRECMAFHARPLDPDGPRFAVRLLRAPAADELCVKLDHLAGDGWSAKEVTCLLAETYSKIAADPSWSPTPDLTPRPSIADVWDALTPAQRDATHGKAPAVKLKWTAVMPRGDRSELTERRLTLSPERFRALKQYGKGRDATVHEILVTALVRTTVRMFPLPEGVAPYVSMSADLRLPVDLARLRRIANLSSTNFVAVEYAPGDGFGEALQRTVGSIRPWKDSLWGVRLLKGARAGLPVMRLLFKAMAGRVRRTNMFVPALLNIGILDEERLAFGDIEPTAAHILGPISRVGGLTITASTYRDALTLSMTTYERDTDPALLEQTLAGFDAELAAAGAAASA